MIEILFKAKRLGNGEWVEGNLVLKRDPKTGATYAFILPQEEIEFAIWYKVDPETVCQYTGVTDKNGKKIFDGDIVNCNEVIGNIHDKEAQV